MDLGNLDLGSVDFRDIGGWPLALRVVAVLVIAAAVLGLGYWFDTRTQLQNLEQERQREQELKTVFEQKSVLAANLEAYEAQMEEMRRSFGAMLRQLPDRTEVADLLVDVSQTGLASGLEFDLFRPQDEVPRDFYAELPISIKVRGRYHEFGAFVSGVAALPRIVTMHDIAIAPIAGDEQGLLGMELTAKTYRYLEEEERQEQAAPAQGGGT